MHSADLDIHLNGVVRRPSAAPPWGTPSHARFDEALRRQPSVMAQVMLDVHPAFTGIAAPSAADVEQAEVLASEWSCLRPAEAAGWLSAHPGIAAEQALVLAEAGWNPRDPRLVVPPRIVELRVHEVRGRHAQQQPVGPRYASAR
jgi:hypothetical protein